MARYRVHTVTTSRTTCAVCDWTSYNIALADGQNHVQRTGHGVIRRLVKETTVQPYSKPGNQNGQSGRNTDEP